VQSRRGADPVYLNTAWVIQIFRGVMLAVATLVVNAVILLGVWTHIVPIGSVYSDQRLPYVISVVSLVPLILGFSSTKLLEARRTLSLSKVTLIEIASQLVKLLTILVWAWLDRSVWALVAGYLAGAIARVFCSHAWLSGKSNRWAWDPSARHELVHFGKWI